LVSREAEGKKNQTTLFSFTVTLTAAYDQTVTLSFRTVDGTAKTSNEDYVARTGTLTFKPGETTKTITIEVKGDSKKEADATFYLDLFALSSNAGEGWWTSVDLWWTCTAARFTNLKWLPGKKLMVPWWTWWTSKALARLRRGLGFVLPAGRGKSGRRCHLGGQGPPGPPAACKRLVQKDLLWWT
jgi:hypothetical protein